MTTNPSPDAVEALYKAMAICYSFVKLDPEGVLAALTKQGFTITRQPAMTDAELEREAHAIAVSAVMCADHSGYIPEVERDIITLAKKYRG